MQCKLCKASINIKWVEQEQDAEVTLWNTRKPMDKIVEQLKKELSNVVFEKATQEVNESFFDGMAYAYGCSIDIIRAGGKEQG